MTLKVRLAPAAGTREAPLQPCTVFDSTGAAIDRVAALAAALAAAPSTLYGALINKNDVTITEASNRQVQFEIAYVRPGRNIVRRSNSVRTEAKKLEHYIAPVGVYDASGDITSTRSKLKWKTNRPGSAELNNIEHAKVVNPLQQSRRLDYETSLPFVTDPYLDLVEDMVTRGVFNDAPFLGRATGELQLVAFDVQEIDSVNWSLGFGFGYKKFQAGLVVESGIAIPELRGCDDYWVQEKVGYLDGELQPEVKAVVVGQAWPFDDFRQLQLPYQGTLTTRSSDTAGVVTTIYRHDITGTDDVIVFWDGGAQVADVSSVGTNTVTFTGGSGDPLPTLLSKVLIAKYSP